MHSGTWRGFALAAGLAWSQQATAQGTQSTASTEGPQREMTLEQVMAHAEDAAPQLSVARERVKRGDAERIAAAPFFPSNPSLSVSGGARFGGGQDGGDVDVGLSQELEIAGEPGLRRDAAERRAQTFDAELSQTRFEVHQRVHVAFHTALLGRDSQRRAEEARKYAEELLEIAQKQVQAGEESPLAEKIARAEVSRAKELQLAAEQQARAARFDLGFVAGLPGGVEVVPVGSLPTAVQTVSLGELVKLARERQPALRVRRAEIEAAKAQLALADREAFPKPAVGVSYAAEGVAPGSNATQQIVLGTLEIPLPLWRQNDGERARARTELGIAEAEERALLHTLENRIARAKARVDADALRIALHMSEILPAADENVRLIQKAFSLGEIDITAVMLARERLISARREALDAYRDYFDALAELEAEVGAEVIEEHTNEGKKP